MAGLIILLAEWRSEGKAGSGLELLDERVITARMLGTLCLTPLGPYMHCLV